MNAFVLQSSAPLPLNGGEVVVSFRVAAAASSIYEPKCDPKVANQNSNKYCSCSCRTLVLCTRMLKSFSRPSFLDCTKGERKTEKS